MKINLGLNVIVILIAFALSGCHSVETISYKSEDEILVYSIDKIPETLINKESTTERENDIICALFEGLVELNESGDVIPSLCQGWKVSEDGLEYTFKLREDIKWSSGEKITSFDFIDYFKYILSPTNKDYNLEELLYVINGASDYNNGLCTFDDVKIKATDNKTIVINLNSVDEGFLKKLSKPVYRLRDTSEPLSSYKDNYSSIRYTGAYTLENAYTNEFTLKENNYYMDEMNGIKEIKIKEQESVQADFALYNLGDIDILAEPPVISLDEGTVYNSINYYPSSTVKTLIFNSENNITSDIRFRQGFFDEMFLGILDSYMMKYSLGTWAFNEIKYDNVLNKTLNLTKEYNVDDKFALEESAKGLLNKLDTRKKIISLVAKNTSENKIICKFISDVLTDKYDIQTKTSLLSDEDLKSYLEEKNFDIYIDDFNLASYKLGSGYDITELEDNLKDGYSIISLYYKNFMWCRSNNINHLYIDGNGNLILKYTTT